MSQRRAVRTEVSTDQAAGITGHSSVRMFRQWARRHEITPVRHVRFGPTLRFAVWDEDTINAHIDCPYGTHAHRQRQ